MATQIELYENIDVVSQKSRAYWMLEGIHSAQSTTNTLNTLSADCGPIHDSSVNVFQNTMDKYNILYLWRFTRKTVGPTHELSIIKASLPLQSGCCLDNNHAKYVYIHI